MIHVFGPKDKKRPSDYVNTTSRSKEDWQRGLSPFFLGPVKLGPGQSSRTMENAWQYSKVYKGQTDDAGNPSTTWLRWAMNGWDNPHAVRYPMGKGAMPLFSWWKNKRLTYVEARKKIYCPLYAGAVRKTAAFERLCQLHAEREDLWLWDFDGYDHRALGMSWKDVVNCPDRKMGHAFVLAMMLEGLKPWK